MRSVRGGSTKDKTANKDEMPEYRSRLDILTASSLGTGGGEADVEFMKGLESISEVATLEQRWISSWASSMRTGCVAHLIIFCIPLLNTY